MMNDDDDDDDDSRAVLDASRERVKRALTRVVLDIVRESVDASSVPDGVAEEALRRCERAFARARAPRGVEPAAVRRDGRALAGRMLVGACAMDWRRTVVTAGELAAFVEVDARATRRLLRAMHADGKVVSQGAIAAEEAFEAASDAQSGIVGERWLARVESEHARATRFCRRRLGLTRARETGAENEKNAENAVVDGTLARDGEEGAFDFVDEWLLRGASSDEDDVDAATGAGASEEDASEDEDEADEDALEAMDAVPSNEKDDDDVESSAFIPVEGAVVEDVEQDNEYFVREIMSLQGASDAEIAQRIHDNVERTKGAENSVAARRALMLHDLFKKYGRTNTEVASHTGAIVRETNSTNPRHKFFAQTDSKTRIKPQTVPVEFNSVTEYVRSNKKAEEARARRVADMLVGRH